MERERAIPSDASLRPADLLVHAWQAGKPLDIDVTVASPLFTLAHAERKTTLKDDQSALDLISQAKVKKYRDLCARDH